MVEKLLTIGFQQYLIDKCVFYEKDIIFIVYVDDGIFLGNSDSSLVVSFHKIKSSGLHVEDQGHPMDYVGVNISKTSDNCYQFSQRTLIDTIIQDVNLSDIYAKPMLAKSSLMLHSFKDSPNLIST